MYCTDDLAEKTFGVVVALIVAGMLALMGAELAKSGHEEAAKPLYTVASGLVLLVVVAAVGPSDILKIFTESAKRV